MYQIETLKKQSVWKHFFEILKMPRPSKKEEKILQFLKAFAEKNSLSLKQDKIGNILISKKATTGFEHLPTIILQSHVDMVCEKHSDKTHNFELDPISPIIKGDWLFADDTTLGADNGIGIAYQLELLESKNIPHGNIECLFTVDEETGLTGAYNLASNFLSGNFLINLDSEDHGEVFIGCAGGIDTNAQYTYKPKTTPNKSIFLKIVVKGLKGGHSGDDIDKGRTNANKLLVRLLWEFDRKYGIRLHNYTGGNLRNAIPREASTIFGVKPKHLEFIRADFNLYLAEIKEVWKFTEPDINLSIASTESPTWVINKGIQKKLFAALYSCPNGVFQMSSRMEGLVETSSNLAAVKFIENNQILVTTSQRSELTHQKKNIAQMIRSVFELSGAKVTHSDGYPGWTPNPNSKLLKIAQNSYKKLFYEEPLVKAIHAGLECGLFLKKYPNLDMISIGPTIKNPHSPTEKIHIETVEKCWKFLLEILKNIQPNN